ncbi:AAA family ATPase [Sinomonas sp. ASV322]|uniref:AAA family ATPase n=1 Tax=Sinomonas sp. ASV322 TaxID=3041920 RepID=UPI0027DB431D|nr:AAA family ATPase [Sinomonas sp. ASV322]MDQ4503572.1 AAA family ATPase [Sinomonas sp. ASV322]
MPSIYFVIGPAGSGKSTVAKLVATERGAVYLDKDSLATYFTEALLTQSGSDPHERDNSEFYQRTVMDLEYATLLRVAGDNLRLGLSVVLDAPFVRYFSREDYIEEAARTHGWPETEAVVVHVSAGSSTVRERVSARSLERDAWKLGHWDEFWAKAQAAECEWRGARHVLFDNSGDGVSAEALTRHL